MLITVGQIRTCGLHSDTKVSTEAQKLPDSQSPATSSPKIVDSRASDPLRVNQLRPMKKLFAGQIMQGQDDDTAVDVADAHLVRADTEHLLGDANHVADRTSLGSLRAWTPHSLGGKSPPDSLTTSKACPTWRAHHQDFYASKWFRSIQILMICSVIGVALILYLFASPVFGPGFILDLFDSYAAILILLPTVLGPTIILSMVVAGGMRWSKVFQ